MDSRDVLVTSPYAYQKASWLVPADLLTPAANIAFNDGDWSGEVDAAVRHARSRDRAQRASQPKTVWGG